MRSLKSKLNRNKSNFVTPLKYQQPSLQCPTLHGTNEFLINNYIESDIKKYFFPLNIVQNCLFFPKYNIRNNFITTVDNRFTGLSFLSSLCFILLLTYFVVHDKGVKNFEPPLLIIMTLNYTNFCLGFVINALINALQRNYFVNLIIVIQRLHRSLKYSKFNIKRATVWNWEYILSMLLFYLVVCLCYIYADKFTYTRGMVFLMLLLADSNIVYMIRTVRLMRNIALSWISEFRCVNEIEEREIMPGHWEETLNTLKGIIEASHIYKEIFGIPILYYLVVMFLQILTNVQILIRSSNVQFLPFIWTLRHVILISWTSIECELFCVTLKNIQVNLFLAAAIEKRTNKCVVYKRLVRQCEGIHKVMEACRIIPVDATLPLRFTSVTVPYTVVLLQIAFL